MIKKIIASVVFIAMSAILVTACTQVSSSLPVEDIDDNSSSIVQSGLPLVVTEPDDGAEINGNTITVNGQTVPEATVIINDQTAKADESGRFSITINLDQGLNAIDVIAVDDNGNEGEILLMVNVLAGK